MSLFSSPASRYGVLLLGGAMAIGGALGCGADQYELRLKESVAYYKFLDNIEKNVAPKWADGVVESLRVPKQFKMIPAPAVVKKEDGTEEFPEVDARQPDYLNLVFPANLLLSAWEAPFVVPLADGASDTRKGYIYVLSNYWMFQGEDPAEALKFTGAMVQLVGDGLEDHIPQEKLENPTVEPHPKRGGYMPEASYQVFEFHPKAITQGSTVNYTFTMYSKQNGDVQAILLVVLPDSVSSQEKLPEKLAMMLDNFQITKSKPRAGGGAPSAPVGPATGF